MVVDERHVKGPAHVQRTVIEKTVIPNYVEKKVQETHYVEKTIRVPQVVERTVRIPAEPTVLERQYEEHPKHVHVL